MSDKETHNWCIDCNKWVIPLHNHDYPDHIIREFLHVATRHGHQCPDPDDTLVVDTFSRAFQTNAIKHDDLKLPWHLLPYDALEEVVKVLQHGAVKYGERNWEQGFKWSRLAAASMRHFVSFWQRKEDLDPETNLHHLAHKLCCDLFLLSHQLRNIGEDDRP